MIMLLESDADRITRFLEDCHGFTGGQESRALLDRLEQARRGYPDPSKSGGEVVEGNGARPSNG